MSGEDPAAAGRESNSRPHRFASTEHLATEAIVAYVDGELRMNAYLRAAEHLAKCPECAAEVDAQQQTRIALRQAAQNHISAPLGLHDTLSRIPLADLAAGAAEAADGVHSNHLRGVNLPNFLHLRTDSFRTVSASDRELGSDSRRWTGWWRK